MNVFLLDDEPLAVKRLRRLLEETRRVCVVGESTDPAQALARLVEIAEPVDALFLDIEMPGLNGFQFLEKLEIEPLVIFTTAYDRYALRAFEVNSIAYLLKPVEPEALHRALDKLDRIAGGSEPRADLRSLVAELGKALGRTGPDHLSRVPSRLGDRIEFVETHLVTHFYSKDKLTYAATGARDLVVDISIAELEQRLDPRRFLRIHRATIVNADHIKELYTWFNGRLVVRLKDGKTELQVARERTAELRRSLGL
ncbi:MAG: LytTR family DNA-binding domain-containing protein [Bryobacteraceae bacterium]